MERKLTKLFRSSLRPIDLDSYLRDLNLYFDEMEKDKETEKSILQKQTEDFHDELLKKYPQVIEVEFNNIDDLKNLIGKYGSLVVCGEEEGELTLYIAE